MQLFRKQSDDELERLAEGPVADFLDQVENAYAQAPSDEAVSEHLAAMRIVAAEATAAGATTAKPPRTRRRLPRVAVRLAAAAGALLLLTAGLAVADVQLPDAAKAPFEAVGIDLPNQSDSASDDAHPTPAVKPAGRRGRPSPDELPRAREGTPAAACRHLDGRAFGKCVSEHARALGISKRPAGSRRGGEGQGTPNGGVGQGKGKGQGGSQGGGSSDGQRNAFGQGQSSPPAHTPPAQPQPQPQAQDNSESSPGIQHRPEGVGR